jgi:hypothetical protein
MLYAGSAFVYSIVNYGLGIFPNYIPVEDSILMG